MKQPKVTVLVTVRNSVRTMKKCVNSLLKQTYKNYDIIVVDAFSDDGTYEVLKSFGKKIKLYQIAGWPPTAYNWAVKKIKSKYVAFTNADCVAHKNWLKEIMKPFDEKGVIAVAGFASNPSKPETRLQEIIGKELENRYNNFPKYINRGPDMNLCVRTDILKKLKFDEKLKVAYDTDFGNRMTKYGKMVYNSEAIVYHYHRASWKSFFKQQKTYAEYVPLVYLKKHKTKIMGDYISKPTMMLQLLLVYFVVVSLFFSIFDTSFLPSAIVPASLILMIWILESLRVANRIEDVFWLFAIFFVRLVAWSVGSVGGFIRYIKFYK